MLSTSGILGYGFAEESLKMGMACEPHVIGVRRRQHRSRARTTSAPASPFSSRLSVKRDLRLMLHGGASRRESRCIVGTAGGAGGEPHLQDTADLVREIAREEGCTSAWR